MDKEINFTYGLKKVKLTFQEDFLAGDLIKPKKNTNTLTREEMTDKINIALETPTGTPKLREMSSDKKVGLVISDEFHSGLQVLIAECLIKEIVKGSPKSLDVFIATGSHSSKIYANKLIPAIQRIVKKLGQEIRILPNNCDSGEHVSLGQTILGTNARVYKEWLKTELRVYGHESKHHYMNGYSAADKQLCPGLCSRATIKSTHKHALNHKLSAAGRIIYHEKESRRENPFAEDNRNVRMLADRHIIIDDELKTVNPLPTFLLDMVSSKDNIEWVMAGGTDIVSRFMTKAVDENAAFELQKTKYVVISPGGPPACNNLYNVQNCFDISLKFAIKQGGEALILAPCTGRPELDNEIRGIAPDKKSKILFWDNLLKLLPKSLDESTAWIKDNFELYLWKTDRLLKLQFEQNVKLYLYSELPDELIKKGGFIPVKDPDKWIAERAKKDDGKIRAIESGNKLLVTNPE